MPLPTIPPILTGLKPGSPQQAEVDAHTKAVAKFATEQHLLTQQICALEIKVASGQASTDEKKKLEQLKALQAANATKEPDPTNTSLTSPDGHAVVNSATIQEYTVKSIDRTPAPEKNIGEVRFVSVDDGDLVSYINATVHLNPWGRMRQCDEDLKNLMATIGRDINNELGEWIGIGKTIAKSATE